MRSLIAASLLTLIYGLSGCTSIHLYSKAADQTAAEVSTDFSASKLSELFAEQRRVFDALQQREVAAFRKLTLAQRELDLVSLMESPERQGRKSNTDDGFVSQFLTYVDTRLEVLDGDPKARASYQASAAKARIKIAAHVAKETRLRLQLSTYRPKIILPACSLDLKRLAENPRRDTYLEIAKIADDKTKAELTETFWNTVSETAKTVADECVQRLNLQASVAQPEKNRRLARAVADLNEIVTELKDANDSAAQAAIRLKQATAKLALSEKDRQKQSAPRGPICASDSSVKRKNVIAEKKTTAELPQTPVSENTSSGATPENELCKVLAELRRMGDLGVKIIAEEKIKMIGAVISALSGVSPQPEDEKLDESLALLAVATRLGNILDRYHATKDLPALEPLIIEKQLAEVELAYATAGERLAVSKRIHSEEIVRAIELEIDLLGDARNTIAAYGPPPPPKTKCPTGLFCNSLEALLGDRTKQNGVPVYRTAYRALALISESHEARDRQRTAEVRLAGLPYESSLFRSEAAVAAWRAIIETPIQQLRSYHTGGLRPEAIAPLLQALGVVGIATK